MIFFLLLMLAIVPPAKPAVSGHAATEKSQSFEQLAQAAARARTENREEDAIRLYGVGLAKQPEWEEGLWYLSTLFYDREQYADARDLLRRFLALRPDAGPGWALLGASEFKTREYSRALDHLQRAMTLGMGDRKEMAESTFYLVAVTLNRLERYDDSMDMLQRMIASNHDPASLIEAAGLAGLRLPLLPEEIPPDRRDLIRMAGEAVIATQSVQGAESPFKQLETAYPNEPGVHFLCGAYLMPTHPNEGIQEMRRELEISPFHVVARVRIAEQYLKDQNVDQASSFAAEAIKLDPKRASAHMILGEAYVAKGDVASAITEFKIARDDDPGAVRIHWDLLRALIADGRTEEANREKQEIKTLNRADSGQVGPQDQSSSDQSNPH